MSLIINQGKQDTSGDTNFEVMVSANEIAQITKMEMDKDWENTLNITFKVISEGKYKGRLFWDRVSFDPKGQFSWKYRNLRKAAGVPYSESESPKIDIEALLLNKAVTVELMVRKGNDGNDYQGVKYKVSNVKTEDTPIATPVQVTEDVVEDVVDDNPFDSDLSTDTDVNW
ncbi:MAG: DUF669 domain-containing protein [Gammaproteobacteria bacterium]|nr:DUF669 domain-containing protein [Gammaproteobacteria bacterium]